MQAHHQGLCVQAVYEKHSLLKLGAHGLGIWGHASIPKSKTSVALWLGGTQLSAAQAWRGQGFSGGMWVMEEGGGRRSHGNSRVPGATVDK